MAEIERTGIRHLHSPANINSLHLAWQGGNMAWIDVCTYRVNAYHIPARKSK